jgi:hypothetical protein
MNLLRPIVGVLGIAILLLSTGDCVNLLFADKEAHDCCLRGECPREQAQVDSCCNIPLSGSAKYGQTSVKVAVSQPESASFDFPIDLFQFQQNAQILSGLGIEAHVHAPPEAIHGLSLPLLI